MSKKYSIEMSRYDQSFILAYDLLTEHIKAGNAVTSDIATCLAELARVIKMHEKETDESPEEGRRT